MELELAYLITS